jgi:hypothetical protein
MSITRCIQWLAATLGGCRCGWGVALMDEEHRQSMQCFAIQPIFSHILAENSDDQ